MDELGWGANSNLCLPRISFTCQGLYGPWSQELWYHRLRGLGDRLTLPLSRNTNVTDHASPVFEEVYYKITTYGTDTTNASKKMWWQQFLNFLTLFCNKPIVPRHPERVQTFCLFLPISHSLLFPCTLPMHKVTLCGLTRKTKKKHFHSNNG